MKLAVSVEMYGTQLSYQIKLPMYLAMYSSRFGTQLPCQIKLVVYLVMYSSRFFSTQGMCTALGRGGDCDL